MSNTASKTRVALVKANEIPPHFGGLVTKLDMNDVLSGRGGWINSFPGNVQFRFILRQERDAYREARKLDKVKIATRIVHLIRSMDPPGRFLEEDEVNHGWAETGDQRAIKKTGQAIREKNCKESVKRKKLEKDNCTQESPQVLMHAQQNSVASLGLQSGNFPPLRPRTDSIVTAAKHSSSVPLSIVSSMKSSHQSILDDQHRRSIQIPLRSAQLLQPTRMLMGPTMTNTGMTSTMQLQQPDLNTLLKFKGNIDQDILNDYYEKVKTTLISKHQQQLLMMNSSQHSGFNPKHSFPGTMSSSVPLSSTAEQFQQLKEECHRAAIDYATDYATSMKLQQQPRWNTEYHGQSIASLITTSNLNGKSERRRQYHTKLRREPSCLPPANLSSSSKINEDIRIQNELLKKEILELEASRLEEKYLSMKNNEHKKRNSKNQIRSEIGLESNIEKEEVVKESNGGGEKDKKDDEVAMLLTTMKNSGCKRRRKE